MKKVKFYFSDYGYFYFNSISWYTAFSENITVEGTNSVSRNLI